MSKLSKQQEFQILVESKVKDGLSTYMDVITDYMVENDLEAKQISKLISPILEEKIRIEAVNNRLINDEEIGSALPLWLD